MNILFRTTGIFLIFVCAVTALTAQDAVNNSRYIAIHYCLPGDENRVEAVENLENVFVLKSSDGLGYLDRPPAVTGFNGNEFFLVPADVSYYHRVRRNSSNGQLYKYCVVGSISVEKRKFGSNQEIINGDSLSGQNRQHQIMVFPNPAQDYFMVQGGYNSMVYIFNHAGNQVHFIRLGDEDNTVDVSGLSSGIYTIKIEKDGIVHHVQLVIQR